MMNPACFLAVLCSLSVGLAAAADTEAPDPGSDILVTFENRGASPVGSGIRAPYRARQRYSIAPTARRDARAIASEFALETVDHWPIKSLGIYCFVYRVPATADRDAVIASLRRDQRVESVQELQQFETRADRSFTYNDTYAELQAGLVALGVPQAHRYTRGAGVRIAMIDSNADVSHEDLEGRVTGISNFAAGDRRQDFTHGTAVASVIAARANNGRGIVGVAPEAGLVLLVACWAAEGHPGAVCDSFTLAKALDAAIADPPDVLNMSLAGPDDPLLDRLVRAAIDAGIVVVAADTGGKGSVGDFPADLPPVVAVASAGIDEAADVDHAKMVFAPGEQIMVAVPHNEYDFRSGSSLAAAQVTGITALLLSQSPDLTPADVKSLLLEAQDVSVSGLTILDACRVLSLADESKNCKSFAARFSALELQPEAQRYP